MPVRFDCRNRILEQAGEPCEVGLRDGVRDGDDPCDSDDAGDNAERGIGRARIIRTFDGAEELREEVGADDNRSAGAQRGGGAVVLAEEVFPPELPKTGFGLRLWLLWAGVLLAAGAAALTLEETLRLRRGSGPAM